MTTISIRPESTNLMTLTIHKSSPTVDEQIELNLNLKLVLAASRVIIFLAKKKKRVIENFLRRHVNISHTSFPIILFTSKPNKKVQKNLVQKTPTM